MGEQRPGRTRTEARSAGGAPARDRARCLGSPTSPTIGATPHTAATLMTTESSSSVHEWKSEA